MTQPGETPDKQTDQPDAAVDQPEAEEDGDGVADVVELPVANTEPGRALEARRDEVEADIHAEAREGVLDTQGETEAQSWALEQDQIATETLDSQLNTMESSLTGALDAVEANIPEVGLFFHKKHDKSLRAALENSGNKMDQFFGEDGQINSTLQEITSLREASDFVGAAEALASLKSALETDLQSVLDALQAGIDEAGESLSLHDELEVALTGAVTKLKTQIGTLNAPTSGFAKVDASLARFADPEQLSADYAEVEAEAQAEAAARDERYGPRDGDTESLSTPAQTPEQALQSLKSSLDPAVLKNAFDAARNKLDEYDPSWWSSTFGDAEQVKEDVQFEFSNLDTALRNIQVDVYSALNINFSQQATLDAEVARYSASLNRIESSLTDVDDVKVDSALRYLRQIEASLVAAQVSARVLGTHQTVQTITQQNETEMTERKQRYQTDIKAMAETADWKNEDWRAQLGYAQHAGIELSNNLLEALAVTPPKNNAELAELVKAETSLHADLFGTTDINWGGQTAGTETTAETAEEEEKAFEDMSRVEQGEYIAETSTKLIATALEAVKEKNWMALMVAAFQLVMLYSQIEWGVPEHMEAVQKVGETFLGDGAFESIAKFEKSISTFLEELNIPENVTGLMNDLTLDQLIAYHDDNDATGLKPEHKQTLDEFKDNALYAKMIKMLLDEDGLNGRHIASQNNQGEMTLARLWINPVVDKAKTHLIEETL